MSELTDRARSFLAGASLTFEDADRLWRELKRADELSFARRVLERLRDGEGLRDRLPANAEARLVLCRQEALLTSKDLELSAAIRHDRALEILREVVDIESRDLDGDGETLGIAGGILKRRWSDLGQLEDLRRAARLYERGAEGTLGYDAFPHINAAFLADLLAHLGDDPVARSEVAEKLRLRIVEHLPPADQVPATDRWFNAATRAEALFGLKRYEEARRALAEVGELPAPWERETTARQLATLAHLHHEDPLAVPEVRGFFDALLPGKAAVRSALAGKLGLALSGGGFRASFYHLGVLARLAELDVLRHVEVLSCVSGGSIIGACYWLALRDRLVKQSPLARADYVALVKKLIAHFLEAVATDVRGSFRISKWKVLWRFLKGGKGAVDPETTAATLEARFLRPLLPEPSSGYLHELPFTPRDHDPALAGPGDFHPGKHNWQRTDKVPILVLNATTVNTGHGWQFTPTWMGESPWATHEAADGVPRLQWSWYVPAAGWQMELSRAVAASACVPGIFSPLTIADAYEGLQVQLVDGGVHDNQGTVSLLAHDCNILLVSDACGQLRLEPGPAAGFAGLAAYALRSQDILMERVRQANFAGLAARKRVGLLRGLMFLHMKDGLDADPIRPRFSQESYELKREALSPSGVRKEFQQALAELRTDLDAFSEIESHGLMACGYQMASCAFQRDLASLHELWEDPVTEDWPFEEILHEITSTAPTTPRRAERLSALRAGSKRRV
jgi:predicted acylesterase/phospholipase RssA